MFYRMATLKDFEIYWKTLAMKPFLKQRYKIKLAIFLKKDPCADDI